MKKFLGILVLSFLWCNVIYPQDLATNLEKLAELYKQGAITKEEFTKAKSIVLKMIDRKTKTNLKKSSEKDNKKAKKKSSAINIEVIEIRKFKDNNPNSFEKLEFILGDYRIYTHRPGGVKVRRLSDDKQLLVISDKLKIKYYNDGRKIFDFKTDEIEENRKKFKLQLGGVTILNGEGKYVKKHRAHFYQIWALDTPFHYYISLHGGRDVALNMEKFDAKIEKAVSKAKVLLAAKHGITVEQINLLLKRKKEKALKKLEAIIGEEKEKFIEKETEKAVEATLEASINQELQAELEKTIGQAMSNEFVNAIEEASGQAIEQAIEDEIASAIDSAIAEAVTEGISEATAAAAIQAMLEVWARGGSDEEAMQACRAHAGDAC